MRGWYLFLLVVFFENTNGINVGVGISDITGPAAEVGMVSLFFEYGKLESFEIVVISDGVCKARSEYRWYSY